MSLTVVVIVCHTCCICQVHHIQTKINNALHSVNALHKIAFIFYSLFSQAFTAVVTAVVSSSLLSHYVCSLQAEFIIFVFGIFAVITRIRVNISIYLICQDAE